jgi:hypothetical protein
LVNGKRTDLTESGRLSMSKSKLGEANPKYKAIPKHIEVLIVDHYNTSGQLSKRFCLEHKISVYLATRLLKNLGLWKQNK